MAKPALLPSSQNCSRNNFRQGPRLSVTRALDESQLEAPKKLAPSSRIQQLEAPRLKPAKLRQGCRQGSTAFDAEGGVAEGATINKRDARWCSNIRAQP